MKKDIFLRKGKGCSNTPQKLFSNVSKSVLFSLSRIEIDKNLRTHREFKYETYTWIKTAAIWNRFSVSESKETGCYFLYQKIILKAVLLFYAHIDKWNGEYVTKNNSNNQYRF